LRAELASGIRAISPDTEVIDGVGNFVLCQLRPEGPDAAEVVRRCRTRGVFVRDVGGMGSMGTMGTHALRVAVKESEIQQRLLEVLAWALVS
jgi:histidinol-phosphate/aromatic aminotransferase/cobyric acid decarboxylase-like protein